jgi:hypothetical protein
VGLNWYLNDTAALLKDQSFLFSSVAQLTRWINVARRDAAKQTGCIQRLITGQSAFGASAQAGTFLPGGAQPGSLPGAFPNASAVGAVQNAFTMMVGVERYPFQGFANPQLQAQHAGCKSIIDVASISVNWGGAVRPSPDWLPWEDFQAQLRAYATLVTSYPSVWSVLNPGENGELWLFPVPSTANEMEWLVYAVPTDLVTDSDYDAIPDGFRESIKYKAAELIYLSSQRFAQAQIMQGLFMSSLGLSTLASDRGKISSNYPTVF